MPKNKTNQSTLRRTNSAPVINVSNGTSEEHGEIKRSSSLGSIPRVLQKVQEQNTESEGYSDSNSEIYFGDAEDNSDTDDYYPAYKGESDSESDPDSEAYLADVDDEVSVEIEDPLKEYDYKALNILTKETDGLTIFNTPLHTEGDPQEVYHIDGKNFQLQNVSGTNLDCFFNATGLNRKGQVAKLKEYQDNPVVRYMVANDIIAGTVVDEEDEFSKLPRSTQKAIGYTNYKSKIAKIAKIEEDRNKKLASQSKNSNAKKTNPGSPSKPLVDRKVIDKKYTQAKHELTNIARTLKAYNAFVNDFIGTNKMLALSPDAKDNMLPYTSIDAIAYINQFGIKVYRPAKGKDNKVIEGKLELIHEFIPQDAKNIIYLYHKGIHFQTLIPIEEFSYIIQMPEYDTIIMPFGKFKKTLSSVEELKGIKHGKKDFLSEITDKLDKLNKNSATIQFVLPNLSIIKENKEVNIKIELESFTNTDFTTEKNQLSIPNNILEKVFEVVVNQIDDIKKEDKALLKTKKELRIVILPDKGFILNILKEFGKSGLQAISEQLSLASTLNAGEIDTLQFSLLLGSVLFPKFATGTFSSLANIWKSMSLANISNSYKNFAISDIPKNFIHNFGKNLGKIGGLVAWIASGVTVLNAFQTTDENEDDYKAMQSVYSVLLLSAAVLGSVSKWLEYREGQQVKLKKIEN